MSVRSDEHRWIHGDEDGGDSGAIGSEWWSTGCRCFRPATYYGEYPK
jgi:hypothetical protein